MVVLEGKDGKKLVMRSVYAVGNLITYRMFDLWVEVPELSKIENAMASLAGVISGSVMLHAASGGNVSGGLVYGALASGDYQTTGTGFGCRVHGITGNVVNIAITQGSGIATGGAKTEISALVITVTAIGT